MGEFIWHQWAQFVAIFASVVTVWASIWGLMFPKFFWDFVNGTNQPGPLNVNGLPCFDDNPCGIVPAASDALFIAIIVKLPVVQLFSLLLGISHLALELVPRIQKTALYRSFVLRIVTLTMQVMFTVLFYQGTNAALYSLVAVIGFTVAQMKGEEWEEAKENRGRGGKA